jgi:hypothetical protein
VVECVERFPFSARSSIWHNVEVSLTEQLLSSRGSLDWLGTRIYHGKMCTRAENILPFPVSSSSFALAFFCPMILLQIFLPFLAFSYYLRHFLSWCWLQINKTHTNQKDFIFIFIFIFNFFSSWQAFDFQLSSALTVCMLPLNKAIARESD